MTIRPLIPGDVPVIAALGERQECWTRCGDDLSEPGPGCLPPEELAFVAVENGEILAYIQFRLGGTFGRSGCITRLLVRKGEQWRGADRRILEYAETMILARGQDLFLLCPSENERARGFWTEMGYRECGRLEGYLQPSTVAILYRKGISPAQRP